MKEDNMMSYEMYEDFKETMVKEIKTELSATGNNNPACRKVGKHRTKQCKHT